MNSTNKVAWFVFGFLAIGVGLYPLMYVFSTGHVGLQLTKTTQLLANVAWNVGFYGHILFGGVALMVGWVQFSKRFREANFKRHRTVGKLYVATALASGICALGIAFFATGGIVAQLGFFSLALVWLYFTLNALWAIKKRDLDMHRVFMIYSYAACFAAVMLRVWLPLLTLTLQDFILAYRMVAWLCWVPNLIFAYFWVRKKGLTLG